MRVQLNGEGSWSAIFWPVVLAFYSISQWLCALFTETCYLVVMDMMIPIMGGSTTLSRPISIPISVVVEWHET